MNEDEKQALSRSLLEKLNATEFNRTEEQEKALEEFVKVYKPLVDTNPEFAEFVKDTIDSFASVAHELNEVYAELEKIQNHCDRLMSAMEMMNEALGNIAEHLSGGKNEKPAKADITH